MTKIYVVFGTTGEYSDHSEWMVKAFREEDSAKDLVTNASRRANEIQVLYPSRWDVPGYRTDEIPEDAKNEFDPKMERDYTGTSYYYGETELE